MIIDFILKSFTVFFIRGFGATAAFLLTLFVSNTTDATQAGLFMYASAIIVLFGSLISCGAPIAILKMVSANSDDDWDTINHDFSFVLMLTCLIGAGCIIALTILPKYISSLLGVPGITRIIPFIGLGIIAFSLMELFANALQGRHKSILASSVQNVITPASFIALLSLFYLIEIKLTSLSLIIIYVVCIFISLIIAVLVWFKYKSANFCFNSNFRPELKTSMSALFVMILMAQCVQWAGQLATGKYLPPADIAYFASAQRTAMLASFVLIAVNLIVAPKFASAFSKGNLNKVNHLSRLSSRLMILMATPVLIFMMLLPEFLMSLFGDEYIVAAPLLQIMAIGQFINVITGSVGYLLNMTNHEKDMRNVVLFSGPLAIVLAFVLTKEYGLIGAAYATAIALATQNLLAVVMVKKRLGFNSLNIFRKIADDLD